MKKIIIMMLVLMTVGIMSAAVVKIGADTYVRNLSFRRADSGTDFEEGFTDYSFHINVSYKLGLQELRFEYLDVDTGQWLFYYDFIGVYSLQTEQWRYYQLMTAYPPTDPINQ